MIRYTLYFSKVSSYDNKMFLWDSNTSGLTLGVTNYDDSIISPTLELEDNAAGSLEFSISPMHQHYDDMTVRDTIIHVYRNDAWLWEGRVMSVEEDFYKERKVYCEGALAYFNDTIQQKQTKSAITVQQMLQNVIGYHNTLVDATIQNGSDKKPYNHIEVGYIRPDISDTPEGTEFEVDYETTMSFISKLSEQYGGHMYIKMNEQTGIKTFEWKNDEILNHAEQTIDFGVNLLDYSNKQEYEEFCTVVRPLGSEIESESGETNGERVMLDPPYVISDKVSEYGWYESILDLDGITDKDELKKYAEEYLKAQFEGGMQDLSLEVTALDLSYLRDQETNNS